ncbi:uncharacterized protein LOC143256693 [Tachypleus tridentatus]|uniref:uncharacterized protein LOC143256693 n=1 Tax=Tachypleus tridentatus TaxID=6853 RepID=UPI003FD5B630
MIAKVFALLFFVVAVSGGLLPYGGQVIKVIQVPSYQPKVVAAPEEAPEPYQFQFENTDDDGNTISRSESGDANGAVSGSYGYKTADGVYRQVEYVADGEGFRPKIKTNEQGTSNSASADVEIVVEEAAAPAPAPAPAPQPAVHKIVKIIQPVHGRYIHVPYYGVHAVA